MAAADPVLNDPDDWAHDVADLYIMEEPEDMLRMLSSFTRPLPPEEAGRRRQAYSGEGGYLTRETLMRALLGEFD